MSTKPTDFTASNIQFYPLANQRQAYLIRMINSRQAIANLTALVHELEEAGPIESLQVNTAFLLVDVLDAIGFGDDEKTLILGFIPPATKSIIH